MAFRLLMHGNTSASDRKTAIVAAMFVIGIAIIDILVTRQLVPYDNFSGSIIFILNIVIAYGIGCYFIMKYVKRTSADIRAKSRSLNYLFWTVVAVQAVLLPILIAMALEFYYYKVSVRYLTYSVFGLSTIVASSVMGIAAFKFFSWYRSGGDKNRLVLICGLACMALATAMIFDATAKLFLVRAVEEESPPGSNPQEFFIYRNDEKYQGEVQYKVVTPDTTTLYIVPSSIRMIYHYINGWIPITISFVFTWAITSILLRQYYQKRVGRFPVIYWILISLPLVLYLMGRTQDWYTLLTNQVWHWEDFSNPMLLKVVFRTGVIGGSILFGVVFFAISRKLTSGRLKDYLTIAAIGAAMMGIVLAPSAQQQTFGVAGRSLMLLASFMLSFGFYVSAVSMAQDAKLRESVRSVAESNELLGTIGDAQRRQEIEKTIVNLVKKERDSIEDEAGIQPPLEEDMKEYIAKVLREVKKGQPSQAA